MDGMDGSGWDEMDGSGWMGWMGWIRMDEAGFVT